MGVYDVTLETTDGLALVADLALPDRDPWAGVVLAHPHPLYGGDRHSPVVAAAFAALADAGVAVLRFDFRGVGRSGGTHGGGIDERLDVAAALDVLDGHTPDVPLVLGGYSFGSLVALNVTDARAAGWLAIAPPLGRPGDGDGDRAGAQPLAGPDHRPKHLVVAEHDQYCPPAQAEAATAGWPATTRVTVPLADHFLLAGLDVVAEQALAFVSRLAGR